MELVPNTKNVSSLDVKNADQGLAQCNLTDHLPVADLTIKLDSKQLVKTPSDYAKPILGALFATALLIVLVPKRKKKKEKEE
jgi:hypothetical protein